MHIRYLYHKTACYLTLIAWNIYRFTTDEARFLQETRRLSLHTTVAISITGTFLYHQEDEQPFYWRPLAL